MNKDRLLTEKERIEIEQQFHLDMEFWWENATDEERKNLTNSPDDLLIRNLKAQDAKTASIKDAEKLDRPDKEKKLEELGTKRWSKRTCPKCDGKGKITYGEWLYG